MMLKMGPPASAAEDEDLSSIALGFTSGYEKIRAMALASGGSRKFVLRITLESMAN